jgi:hypothetical protein
MTGELHWRASRRFLSKKSRQAFDWQMPDPDVIQLADDVGIARHCLMPESFSSLLVAGLSPVN